MSDANAVQFTEKERMQGYGQDLHLEELCITRNEMRSPDEQTLTAMKSENDELRPRLRSE